MKECPKCKSTNLQTNGFRAGKQRYKCKDCKANFTEGVPYKTVIPKKPLTNIICPNCKSNKIVRDGKLEGGSQRYQCKECHTNFSSKTKFSSLKEEIVKAVLAGKNVYELTKENNFSKDFIRKLMIPYYKKEAITQGQINLIVKYGYYLKVPVNYMAEYIKCSEHKCREILKKYKNKVMSTNPCAN